MTNVNLYGELLDALNTGGVDTLVAQAVGANRRCAVRNVRFTFIDDTVGGGWGIFRIIVTNAVTAAQITGWGTSLVALAGIVGGFAADIQMHFDSGAQGAIVTVTSETQNGAATTVHLTTGQVSLVTEP